MRNSEARIGPIFIALLAVTILSVQATDNEVELDDDFMEPPSVNMTPNCFGLIGKVLGGGRPSSRKEIDTRFFLTTRQKKRRVEVTLRSKFRSQGHGYNLRRWFSKRKTVIITHGFRSHSYAKWTKDMTKALLQKEDANIIRVDWKRGAKMLNYRQAVSNTKIVGAEIARFVRYLVRKFEIPLKDFHLIGHSLGAQISSYVSSHVKGKIGRLTALDPASPCFAEENKDMRVDPSDADFVDVIHTNGNEDGGLGILKPVGHVDFYPNGGKEQPGCIRTEPKGPFFEWIKKPIYWLKTAICSHSLACDYFTESLKIKKCRFWGHKWDEHSIHSKDLNCTSDTCTPMGFDSELFPARGSFFVPVIDATPHCVKDESADKRLLPWIKRRNTN